VSVRMVTDARNGVVVPLRDGSVLWLSPREPAAFLAGVRAAAPAGVLV
jgi:hypothetical protein